MEPCVYSETGEGHCKMIEDVQVSILVSIILKMYKSIILKLLGIIHLTSTFVAFIHIHVLNGIHCGLIILFSAPLLPHHHGCENSRVNL